MSTVSIRYMIDDIPAAIKFYTTHFGFSLDLDASPAFASAARPAPAAGPCPTGANRSTAAGTGFRIQANDIDREVKRLREAGLEFKSEFVKGPGSQTLLDEPSGNPVKLFQPAKS
jgi:predicted enzyme related to lactoylglutathione lyase